MKPTCQALVDYHERTKHRPGRYARSLGFMDWSSQPHPFRRYRGAPLVPLERPRPGDAPSLDLLGTLPPADLDRATLSQLLFDSLALSAWKRAGRSRWSLRCNPSSGNLHPTEAYLLWDGALHHYAPEVHALEHLAEVPTEPGAALVGLTSIPLRESWKYGERALRYCHLDTGHALGALGYAAAALGWEARPVPVEDDLLRDLLGIHAQSGPEAEHPEGLVSVGPVSGTAQRRWVDHGLAVERLATRHHAWEAIDHALAAGRVTTAPAWSAPSPPLPEAPRDRALSARRLFRSRRSAQAFDGTTGTTVEALGRLLAATLPGRAPVRSLPWQPAVSLLLFVHRVEGLAPGLYLYARHHDHLPALRRALSEHLAWAPTPVEGLHLLAEEDVRQAARGLSCHQDIAADGAFAVAMLTRFDEGLREEGPGWYRYAHWECGLVGQVLYIEAEAAGLRGTGIGCFFDDVVHESIGLDGRAWQSLYHFTVGAPVDDLRVETLPAYPIS